MPFVNITNCLVKDSRGNVYNIKWEDSKIIKVFYNKVTKDSEKTVLSEDCSMEFDVTLDNDDNVYVFYRKNAGSLYLASLVNGSWHADLLMDNSSVNIQNLSTIMLEDNLHIFYAIESDERDYDYKIYHHFFSNEKWHSHTAASVHQRNYLNPLRVFVFNGKLSIAYCDCDDKADAIWIKTFDPNGDSWSEGNLIVSSPIEKIYLDILPIDSEGIHLTYSEFVNGNLVIKYEKIRVFDTGFESIKREILSNPANCSYPTLLMYEGKLWLIWTEYDQISSSYSLDNGETWSSPYLWKDTRTIDFFRYKFLSPDEDKKLYKFDYSFGRDNPNIYFIGFGNLEDAVETPLKKNSPQGGEKLREQNIKEEPEVSQKINEGIRDELKEEKPLTPEERLSKLETDFERLETRVNKIEKYLKRSLFIF